MTDGAIDKPLEIVRKLRGVVHAFYLDDDILERMREEESKVRAAGDITVDNQGFTQALERDSVICIIKDPRFRPPPEPTVVLKSGEGETMGVEVFPWTSKEYMNREDVAWLSDAFVLFPHVEVRGGEHFVMPPVPFPELDGEAGCKDVISCSPAPTCDLMMRKYMGYDDDAKLASILIAFNRD